MGEQLALGPKLGMTDAAELLQATLQEEKETDMKLSELALSEINIEAEEASEATDEKRSSADPAARVVFAARAFRYPAALSATLL